MKFAGLIKPVIAALVVLLFVSSAFAAGPHTGELHVNWWSWDMHAPPIGWFIVNFILFVWLIAFVAKKPIGNALAKRHQTIKEAIERNQVEQEQARKQRAEIQAKLAQVDKEVELIVAKGAEQGQAEHDKILDGAKGYSNTLHKDRETQMQQDLARARRKLEAQGVRDVLDRAEGLLNKEITNADRQRLLDEAIESLENGSATAIRAGRPSSPSQQALGGAA